MYSTPCTVYMNSIHVQYTCTQLLYFVTMCVLEWPIVYVHKLTLIASCLITLLVPIARNNYDVISCSRQAIPSSSIKCN